MDTYAELYARANGILVLIDQLEAEAERPELGDELVTSAAARLGMARSHVEAFKSALERERDGKVAH